MCLKSCYKKTSLEGKQEASYSIPPKKSTPFYECQIDYAKEKFPLLFSKKKKEESALSIILQVIGPFLLAGVGVVFTGMSLDTIQHWPVFKLTPQLIILVPSLLGLKGNLEMTLASRLSTQVNLGAADSAKERYKLVKGNMALLLCQGIVVGFLAAILAILMDLNNFSWSKAALTNASSILTAVIACIVLGSITMGVVFGSHALKINPDNVAAPLASACGDVTTLWLLAGCSSMLNKVTLGDPIILFGIVLLFLLLSPVLAMIANNNEYTHQVLREVWVPIIIAIALSSVSGFVLSAIMNESEYIALFQPVINGIGGNLVAVQASRLSTYLHKMAQKDEYFTIPVCFTPDRIFSLKDANGKSATILLCIGIPGHALFLGILFLSKLWKVDHDLSIAFFFCYLLMTALQVMILLYAAQIIISILWKLGVDPDNAALPFLTALGDCLGTCLLAFAFYIT